jgi:predicted nuclease of predicted toxin-antitoxin system
LSLKLFIDEDSQDKILVKLLFQAGHDVVTVNEVGMNGQPDSVVFAYAKQQNRLLFTFNCDDFEALHLANPDHPGILVVYQQADFAKNMSYKAILKAIANLEASGVPLAKQFISLNHWNY